MELPIIFGIATIVAAAIFFAVRNRPEPKLFDGVKPAPIPAYHVIDGIKKEAEKYGLSAVMCLALAKDESSFSPTAVNIKENAIGIFQIRPIAFEEYVLRGKNTGGWQHNELIDPQKNVAVGVWYLFWIQGKLRNSWSREPSHREIILAFKGGIGNVLRRTVSDDAMEFTDRTLAREVEFA